MNISEKSKSIIDACRFCWMCRHICPIGNAVSEERNNARARMMGLSLVIRNVEKINEFIDNIYECSLCGACTKECVTGWDPVYAIQESKTKALTEVEIPKYVESLLENDEKYGNIYGIEIPETYKKLANNKKSDTLLFFGNDAKFKNAKACENAISLLEKSNLEFTTLEDEKDSGSSFYFLLGKSEETRQKMIKCAEQLNKFKTVIVYDPIDLKLFLREYKEWGIEITANIISFNKYLFDLIKNKNIKVKKSNYEYTMQDNYSITRDLSDLQTSRFLIEYCGNVKDMLLFGKDTMFAGSLIMYEYMPNTMLLVAKKRWDDAQRIGAKCLVTESPSEHALLKITKPDNIDLVTIEEMILNNLE